MPGQRLPLTKPVFQDSGDTAYGSGFLRLLFLIFIPLVALVRVSRPVASWKLLSNPSPSARTRGEPARTSVSQLLKLEEYHHHSLKSMRSKRHLKPGAALDPRSVELISAHGNLDHRPQRGTGIGSRLVEWRDHPFCICDIDREGSAPA